MIGRIVFVIVYRLFIIKNLKVIILFEGGNIIECGSYNELIDLKGIYYEFFIGSFELE